MMNIKKVTNVTVKAAKMGLSFLSFQFLCKGFSPVQQKMFWGWYCSISFVLPCSHLVYILGVLAYNKMTVK